MKVSIITVCYNAAGFIEEALLSIQSQTYKDIEKIIIDGGSSDGTQDIVRKYLTTKDKFVSEKDQGIYDAMNKGVAMASGEVVYFLNADDSFIDSDVIDQMVKVFRNDPELVLIYGQVKYKNVPAGYRPKQPQQIYSVYAFLSQTICHQAVFVRRVLFGEIGEFNIKYRYVADQEWLLRAFKRHNHHFIYWDRIIAFYEYQGRSHQNGEIARKEKKDILCLNFSWAVFFIYWFRYVFIRGLKKKILREGW